MAIQPLTGACFVIVANVVFISLTGGKKQHFGAFVKWIFCDDGSEIRRLRRLTQILGVSWRPIIGIFHRCRILHALRGISTQYVSEDKSCYLPRLRVLKLRYLVC